MVRKYRFVQFFIGVVLLSYAFVSHAEGKIPYGPTDSELGMLPPYCHARLRGDKNTKKMWNDQMGQDIFVHLHHYCFGLNFLNRANFAIDDKQRQFNLRRSAQNFDYVLNAWPSSHPLAIQAAQYKSQAQMKQTAK